MNHQVITLYSSIGCHFCEEARAMLQYVLSKHHLPYQIDEVDVLTSDRIEATYASRIPVVVFAGQELDCPIELAALERLLLEGE